MSSKKLSWFEFKLYIILAVIEQHRKTSAFALGSDVWGDINPMLNRMRRDFLKQAESYAGKQEKKEAIIDTAIEKIASFYREPAALLFQAS